MLELHYINFLIVEMSIPLLDLKNILKIVKLHDFSEKESGCICCYHMITLELLKTKRKPSSK